MGAIYSITIPPPIVPEPTTYYGVDFSGAATPGNDIWIAEGQATDTSLEIDYCQSASERLELKTTEERAVVLGAFVKMVRESDDAIWGLDFPFGLPHAIVNGRPWPESIDWIVDLEANSAVKFRERCAEEADNIDGSSSYLRRETDFRFAAQCPYGVQIQYQTFHGQTQLLRQLLDDVRVPPMQPRDADKPTLVETYPAATLGTFQLYRHGYKRHPKAKDRRNAILEGLAHRGFHISDNVHQECIRTDNALDGVLCAIAAHRAHEGGYTRVDKTADVEGQIFA